MYTYTGRGIQELETLLTKVALEQSGTIRRVPKLFFKLEDQLTKYVEQNLFSLTDIEFMSVATEQIKLSVDSANLARDLFKMWGLIKVLFFLFFFSYTIIRR
jgi:hypothetical protein